MKYYLGYTREQWERFAKEHPKIKRMRRKTKLPYLMASINHYYGFRGMITKNKKVHVQKYLLPETVAFIDFIRHRFNKSPYRFDMNTPLKLFVIAEYKDNRRRDTDNPKAVMDALKDDDSGQYLFADDSIIFKTTYEKRLGCDKDRVKIYIQEM